MSKRIKIITLLTLLFLIVLFIVRINIPLSCRLYQYPFVASGINAIRNTRLPEKEIPELGDGIVIDTLFVDLTNYTVDLNLFINSKNHEYKKECAIFADAVNNLSDLIRENEPFFLSKCKITVRMVDVGGANFGITLKNFSESINGNELLNENSYEFDTLEYAPLDKSPLSNLQCFEDVKKLLLTDAVDIDNISVMDKMKNLQEIQVEKGLFTPEQEKKLKTAHENINIVYK